MLKYFDSNTFEGFTRLSKELLNVFSDKSTKNRQKVILCIGSDRSTGDCLGPLVGYKLSQNIYNNVVIIGTLKEPVHAINLSETINRINKTYVNPYIIAIDASLGRKDHVGFITLGNGPLQPGLGVNKNLPSVGDMHITGIVNIPGSGGNMILQTTRLSVIMTLADMIYESMNLAISES